MLYRPSGKRKKPSPTEHGFDYWFGLSNGAHPSHKDPVNFLRNGKRVGPLKGYSCQLIVDDAIRWLDQKEHPDQPFFLNLWFNEPHHKLAAPAEIVARLPGIAGQLSASRPGPDGVRFTSAALDPAAAERIVEECADLIAAGNRG